MQTSETIEALCVDLVAAQAEIKNAAYNRENNHLKSKYADLSAVREATMPALIKHGLTIVQTTEIRESGLVLVSRLQHKSGQFLESVFPLPNDISKMQAVGSALSYARRYTWSAICGIASTEDDDANIAQAAGGTRNHGPSEPVIGALNKTALTAKLREFAEALTICGDENQLYGLLESYKAELAQCKRDLPSWWLTKEGADAKGLHDRIEDKKRELEQPREPEQA